jgi:hypothetical protein
MWRTEHLRYFVHARSWSKELHRRAMSVSWSAWVQEELKTHKPLQVSIVKKMRSHTLVAFVGPGVEDTDLAKTAEGLVDDGLDDDELDDGEEDPGVLELEPTDAEEGVVPPPAVPEGEALS